MIPFARLLVIPLLLGGGARAWAEDDETDTKDQLIEDTVSGKALPKLGGDVVGEVTTVAPGEEAVEATSMPYSEKAYRGARILRLDVEFVEELLGAVEMLFLRDYKGAKNRFATLGTRYRGSALEPAGQVLVWQALMLENFDFRYDSQYWTASKRSRQQLEEALQIPGNEAWERFVLGGILGIEAIHNLRQGDYFTALNTAYEAMKSVNRCQELAPDFKDAFLGDGMYNYWRTVITMNTKGLPDFGDKRAEGIRQMSEVERDGIFLGPPATLALTYTWIEEGEMKRALASAKRNQQAYPNNVINNLVLGRVHMYMRHYDEALATFKGVERISPENNRVHYYETLLFLRTGDLDDAEKSIDRYLGNPLQPDFEAAAHYQKGLIYYRRKDWDAAEREFKAAWKLGKLKRAKTRLDVIEKKRIGR